MPQFSFIIPVYNTEKYLRKCLNSLLEQTYDDYEIIVINDGSTDNSQLIIDEYKQKSRKIKGYVKANSGVSDTRNYGVKKAKGEYILFVDSDDYVDIRLLERVRNIILRDGNIDLIKFNFAYVTNDLITSETDNINIRKQSGKEAFVDLVNSKHPFDMVWLYAYNKEFWLKNNFSYAKGTYHEDFGLIPIVVLKAKEMSNINSHLYYYIQSNNSITRNNDLNKTLKRTNDMLNHYEFLKQQFDDMKTDDEHLKSLFYSYISNALIERAKELKGEHLHNYIKELQKRNLFDNLMSDTIVRRLKKQLLKKYPKLFIKAL
jgi:glycosyltransferase involved in cell wall biosynthesis